MYTVQQRQCFTQGENVELLAQYGLFLAKIATVVVAIAVIAAIIVNLAQRKKQRGGVGQIFHGQNRGNRNQWRNSRLLAGFAFAC